MNQFLSSRIAAKAGTRAAELVDHADTIGERTNRIVSAAWAKLWRGLKPGPHLYHANRHHAARVLHDMAAQLWQTLHGDLAGLIRWSHDRAAQAMVQTLPKAYLRAATRLQESCDGRAYRHGHLRGDGDNPALHPMAGVSGAREVALLEAGGALAFGLYTPWNAPAEFTATDLADPLRGEPAFPFGANPPALSADEERDLFMSLLFQPPSHDEVQGILSRILSPREWLGTVGQGTVMQTSDQLANSIALQYAGGATTKQVAVAIRGYFDGSAMRATRAARTLGAYVGTERGLAVDAGMGDLIIGWQVRDAFGRNARPSHALRSGTIYYKHPKPGQYGVDVMPHPPQDTQRGPHDDMTAPRGLCYNCRCFMLPVLANLPAMQTPAYLDNADQLIPDTATFQDWFAKASPRQRNAAAGVRRIATARNILGREPEWSDMVDASTGRLLTLAQLKSEPHRDRLARVAKVNATIAKNRAAVQHVAAYGTDKLPPAPVVSLPTKPLPTKFKVREFEQEAAKIGIDKDILRLEVGKLVAAGVPRDEAYRQAKELLVKRYTDFSQAFAAALTPRDELAKERTPDTRPRAPAGGAISPVDGVFYPGGHYMPVHGLSPKVEKKPKGTGTTDDEFKANEDKAKSTREPRAMHVMTPEEIEAERQRREDIRLWREIAAGPLGQVKGWMGENPSVKAMTGGIVLAKWMEWAPKLGEARLAALAVKLGGVFAANIAAEDAAEVAKTGKAIPPDNLQWALDEPQRAAAEDTTQTRKTAKHTRDLPSSLYVRQLLQSLMYGIKSVGELYALHLLLVAA